MVTTHTVSLNRNGEQLPIHRWIPEQPRAGVVVVQEIFGVSTYIRDRALDLAHAGYVVDVPELYFRLEDPVVADDDPNLLNRGMELMNNTPWDQAVADVVSAVNNLKSSLGSLLGTAGNPDVAGNLGVVGFCYGGGLAYAATAQTEATGTSPIDALVSYYGSALPTLLDLQVNTPSLHHFGTADSFIPMDQVEKIKAHVEPTGAQFYLYDGADHAFDNTLEAFHHPQAAHQAWQRSLEFLSIHLG
ncbi:MAG TPA: dienelactone hydrolase family protein [Beutenbergiaceae bacterium]|nr:dienelactone hydrolase family protein [Beutenbergiaceae bacterium]